MSDRCALTLISIEVESAHHAKRSFSARVSCHVKVRPTPAAGRETRNFEPFGGDLEQLRDALADQFGDFGLLRTAQRGVDPFNRDLGVQGIARSTACLGAGRLEHFIARYMPLFLQEKWPGLQSPDYTYSENVIGGAATLGSSTITPETAVRSEVVSVLVIERLPAKTSANRDISMRCLPWGDTYSLEKPGVRALKLCRNIPRN